MRQRDGRVSPGRATLTIAVLLVTVSSSAQAVIPGIAPGLIAILPQLLFLVVATLTLLVSPRTWWRGMILALRHPAYSLATILTVAGAVFGIQALAAWVPEAAPGAPIPDRVHGFPIGDACAARSPASGNGPITPPEVRVGVWSEPAPPPQAALVSMGAKVVRVESSAGRTHLRCLDPAAPRVLWELELDRNVATEPIAFERCEDGGNGNGNGDGDGDCRRGILVVTDDSMVVLDDSGTELGKLPLSPRPQAAALVDDTLVLASEETVVGISLAELSRPRPLSWSLPDRDDNALKTIVAVAGDASGRFFLLGHRGLSAGELESGALRPLRSYADGTSLRLASRDGRILVLRRAVDQQHYLECVDAARSGTEWSVSIDAPLDDDFSVAPFGIVVTHAGGVTILDPASGTRRHWLSLDSVPLCPAVWGSSACYVLLATRDAPDARGASVLRYSPGLERVEWRHDLVPTGDPATSGGRIVVTQERLMVDMNGVPHVLSEPEGSVVPPWSQWRGGPSRRGAAEGATVPLEARVLWQQRIADSANNNNKPSTADAPTSLVFPLREGALAAHSDGAVTHLLQVNQDGEPLARSSLEGRCAGLVRVGDRVFVASDKPGATADEVLSLSTPRADDPESALAILWRIPIDSVSKPWPLAAARDLLVVATRAGLQAVRVDDGTRRWAVPALGGAGAPVIARGKVFYARSGRNAHLAALDLRTGKSLFERTEAGWQWRAPSVLNDTLYVSATDSAGQGWIRAMNVADGTDVWRYKTGAELIAGPPVATADLIVAHGRSGGLYLLGMDGTEKIRRPGQRQLAAATYTRVDRPLAVDLGVVIYAAGAEVRCVDSLSLDAIWTTKLVAEPTDIALHGETVLVTAGGNLLCLGSD